MMNFALARMGSMAAFLLASPPSGTGEIETLVERLKDAERRTNLDPLQADDLATVLDLVSDHAPAVAHDARALEARMMAQLTLARAWLIVEDAAQATKAMDEAIRIARGDPLPTHVFGPRIEELHRQRAAAMHEEGHATLEVECKVPCDVYLDERRAGTLEPDLLVGEYRLWVEARPPTPGAEMRRTVTLTRRGEVVELLFPEQPSPVSKAVRPPQPQPMVDQRRAPQHRRMLPRWLEITGIAAGLVGVGVGAWLLAAHDTCVGAEAPRCPNLWVTRDAGIGVLTAGGAVLLPATVLLATDEVWQRRRHSSPDRISGGWRNDSPLRMSFVYTVRF